MKEDKKAVLVVGADSDIGCELIKLIDDDVVAHYFADEKKLTPLKSKNRNIRPVFGDLSTVDGIKSFISDVEKISGNIEKIVHLPSLPARTERFRDFDADMYLRDITVQALSAGLIFSAFLPKMAKRGFGRVAVVLTAYCIGVPPKFLTSYVSAKYALLGMVKSAAVEFAPKGVLVNAVAPSMTETKFLSSLPDFEIEATAKANPTGRNARPEDIAPTLKLLLDENNGFMTGAVIPITGGGSFY